MNKKQKYTVTRSPRKGARIQLFPQQFEYRLSPARLRRLLERMNARDKYFSWAAMP